MKLNRELTIDRREGRPQSAITVATVAISELRRDRQLDARVQCVVCTSSAITDSFSQRRRCDP